MKFTKKRYTILNHFPDVKKMSSFLETGFTQKLNSIGEKEKTTFIEAFSSTLTLNCEKRNVDYVSSSFFLKTHQGNIFEKLTSIYNELPDSSGTLLYPVKFFSQIHASQYTILDEGKEKLGLLNLYAINGLVASIKFTVGERIDFIGIVSNTLTRQTTEEECNNWIFNHVQSCLALVTFKKFAEIETVELGGDFPSKTKINNEKYINEFNTQINVLDSKWFKNIERNKEFKVSGHFRLQPYGANLSERKLIYIDDFTKSGYKLKARKNNHK